jgi:hypothetical protein
MENIVHSDSRLEKIILIFESFCARLASKVANSANMTSQKNPEFLRTRIRVRVHIQTVPVNFV